MDQVPFQRAAPVVISAVGDARAPAATADIVDQNVDAAKGCDDGLDQPACVIGIADIACVSRNFGAGRAQGRFRFAQLLDRARRQHDSATLGANALAVAKPMPRLEPVSRAPLPVNFRSITLSSSAPYPSSRALRSAIQDFTRS